MRAIAMPLLAAGGAVAGVVYVAAALTPSPSGLADRAAHLAGAQALDRPQTAMLGVATLALSHAVFRRRRLALWATFAVLAAFALVAMRHHPVRVVALGVLLGILVAERQEFRARPDPRRLRGAAMLGIGVLTLVLGYGVWDTLVLRDRPWPGVSAVLSGTLTASTGTRADLLALGVTVAVLVMLILALGPTASPGPGSADQREAVLLLANHADSDSLAPFAARWDKSYVFSPDGQAAIGYRVVLGTALASGDPVGNRVSATAAMAAFLDLSRRRGWRPGVLGASDPTAARWRDLGLRGIVIGDEAVLDVTGFTLESRRMRNVRQAVARTHRAGVDVRIGPMTTQLGRTLEPVLSDWLDGRRLRGFSMNLDLTLAPRPGSVVATAYGGDGQPVAFALFAECGGGRTLTLDISPRHRDAPNGIVERLIVEIVGYAQASGASEVSLNFAGLRRVFESRTAPGRAGAALAHAFDAWIELAPLYRFCAKFHPQWRPRSLMLGSWSSIGAVGAAAIVAEMRSTPPDPATRSWDQTSPAGEPSTP
jgi:lysyl-tRNA synthetase class 2